MKARITAVVCTLVIAVAAEGLLLSSHHFARAASSATVSATAKISVCGNNVREGGEQCDGSDVGGRTCGNLGFDGGSLSCSASCEFNTASCTTNAQQTATPLFTSDIGGNYTITDGSDSAKASLPANFYAEDLRLQMFAFGKTYISATEPAPSGKDFIGKVYVFLFVNPDGGTVSTLSKPVTITLTYAAADVSGIDISTLAPYRRESGDTSWSPVTGYTVDAANHTVTFTTSSFSSFTLFGSSQTTPSQPSSSSSGSSGSILPFWTLITSVTSPATTTPEPEPQTINEPAQTPPGAPAEPGPSGAPSAGNTVQPASSAQEEPSQSGESAGTPTESASTTLPSSQSSDAEASTTPGTPQQHRRAIVKSAGYLILMFMLLRIAIL